MVDDFDFVLILFSTICSFNFDTAKAGSRVLIVPHGLDTIRDFFSSTSEVLESKKTSVWYGVKVLTSSEEKQTSKSLVPTLANTVSILF